MIKYHIRRGDYSVLILTPQPPFLKLVAEAAKQQSAVLSDIYFPEEDAVLLVPPIGSFPDYVAFEAFVSSLKIELLGREFGKFGIPYPEENLSAAVFDTLFSIAIRDRAELVIAES